MAIVASQLPIKICVKKHIPSKQLSNLDDQTPQGWESPNNNLQELQIAIPNRSIL